MQFTAASEDDGPEQLHTLLPHLTRDGLFRAASLPIVKDSSANKCGAICSPAEIPPIP